MEAFITSLQQQAENANETFCRYAIEIVSRLLRGPLPAGVDQQQQHDPAIIVEYCSHMEWQAYYEVIEHRTLQSAYAPGQFQLASRGRPRFDISLDQLEYHQCPSHGPR